MRHIVIYISSVCFDILVRKMAHQIQTFANQVSAQQFSSKRLGIRCNIVNEVVVTFVISPHDFYIQLPCFDKKFRKLMKYIQKSAIQSHPMLNPVEGMPCLALFPYDRKWYRAIVLSVMPDGIVIRFVDTGMLQKSPNSADTIRQMQIKKAQSPFFAIHSKLANVCP